MPFQIVRDDITRMRVDAIVCPTDEVLSGSGGLDASVRAAAGPGLAAACRELGGCAAGDARIVPGFDLPAKHVIFAVGPRWTGADKTEPELLRSCIRADLHLAAEHSLESVAIPLIATGTFGFPKEPAMRAHREEILRFLDTGGRDITVYLVLYSSQSAELGSRLFSQVREYISDHYADEHKSPFHAPSWRPGGSSSQELGKVSSPSPGNAPGPDINPRPEDLSWGAPSVLPEDDLFFYPAAPSDAADESPFPSSWEDDLFSDYIHFDITAPGPPAPSGPDKEPEKPEEQRDEPPVCHDAAIPSPHASSAWEKRPAHPDWRKADLDESFQQMLFRLIDTRGLTDPQCYTRANVDRRIFSRIRSNVHYQPSKPTAVAFAMALELNMDDTEELLRKAGYALSKNNLFDLIVSFFIESRYYNVLDINIVLYDYDQPQLGSVTRAT